MRAKRPRGAFPGHLPAPRREHGRDPPRGRGPPRRLGDVRGDGGFVARIVEQGFRRRQTQASVASREVSTRALGARRSLHGPPRVRRRGRTHRVRPRVRVRTPRVPMGAQDRRRRRLRRSRHSTSRARRRVASRRPSRRPPHRGCRKDDLLRASRRGHPTGVRVQPTTGRRRSRLFRFRRGVPPRRGFVRVAPERRARPARRARRRTTPGSSPGVDAHRAPARAGHDRGQLSALGGARGVAGLRPRRAVGRVSPGESVQAQIRRRGVFVRGAHHRPVASRGVQRRTRSVFGAHLAVSANRRDAPDARRVRRRGDVGVGGGNGGGSDEGDGARLRARAESRGVATPAAARRRGGGGGGGDRGGGGGGGGGERRRRRRQGGGETRGGGPRGRRRSGGGARGVGAGDGRRRRTRRRARIPRAGERRRGDAGERLRRRRRRDRARAAQQEE